MAKIELDQTVRRIVVRGHYQNVASNEGETIEGESLVDLHGYVEGSKKIEGMLYAGRLLDDYRDHMFHDLSGDVEGDDEDLMGFDDPTLDPDFDLLAAREYQADLERKYRLHMKEVAKKAYVDDSKKEEPSSKAIEEGNIDG